MANEVTPITGSLGATKSSIGLVLQTVSYTQTDDMAGTHTHCTVQDIGTTYEALAVGADCATVGWAIFQNLDVTNYVEVGIEHSGSTFVAFLYIGPQKYAGPVRLSPAYNAVFAKANTAAVKLRMWILER